MGYILGFGEVMIRMTPSGHDKFSQINQAHWFAGGAEANVLSNLAQWGYQTQLLTKLPIHELGQWVKDRLTMAKIGTDFVLSGGDRVGLYYQETGVGHRPSKIIYDRQGAAIQSLTLDEIPLTNLETNTHWFHTSGITIALHHQLLNITQQLLQRFKAKQIPISFDVNYRKKLWSVDQAKQAINNLLPLIDYLIVNEEDLSLIFSADLKNTNIEKGVIDHHAYANALSRLLKTYPHLKGVAVTLRTSLSASYNQWQGLYQTATGLTISRQYDLQPIVDRIGSGDAFAAGMIAAILSNQTPQQLIEFATAAGASKHFIAGDFNLTSKAEIEALVLGNGGGRIIR